MNENRDSTKIQAEFDAWRAIDANLNRCAEGMRTVEDVFRFGVSDALLSKTAKKMRHQLAAIAKTFGRIDLVAARDAGSDVGRRIETKAEYERDSIETIVVSNFQRIQQSLRTLEEFSKTVAVEVARDFESLRYEIYTLQKAAEVLLYSHAALESIRICVLLEAKTSESEFREFVEQILQHGPLMIQLRDKSADDQLLIDRGRILGELSRDTDSIWIMNDRADLAAVCNADGVHLGQEDLAVADARRIVGTRKLIGVSTHRISQARRAVMAGANYLGVGPTFSSQTKTFAELAGLDFVRSVAEEISLPAFAIGGIDLANVDAVLSAGAIRIAVSNAARQKKSFAKLYEKLFGVADPC